MHVFIVEPIITKLSATMTGAKSALLHAVARGRTRVPLSTNKIRYIAQTQVVFSVHHSRIYRGGFISEHKYHSLTHGLPLPLPSRRPHGRAVRTVFRSTSTNARSSRRLIRYSSIVSLSCWRARQVMRAAAAAAAAAAGSPSCQWSWWYMQRDMALSPFFH